MIALLQKKWPSATEALIDGKLVMVAVRVSERSRNYRLSIPHAGGPVLTVPRYGNWKEASDFLNRQLPWLAARLKRAAKPVTFKAGARIPVRGIEHRIVATGRVRGHVEAYEEEGEMVLAVPGEPAHRARRLTDWLKSEAQKDIGRRVAVHARRLGVEIRSISLRSQTTRWGSCSTTGRLNFNWRLVMAPPFVLDYVAAHEVAHLVEMNHSEAFWATVERTLPSMERGREWLRAHGRQLMVYGIEA
ncbi:MAG TPA: M48 family metallopeptidase [Alphaproteobacteria bacterium]|nr:M48 family metallopeptidase [Alphaproteobacteria bacterium]